MNDLTIQKSLTILNFLLTKTFFSKLRNKNSLKEGYSDFQSVKDGGLASKKALSKLKLKQTPAKTINTWPMGGNKKSCVTAESFFADITRRRMFLR